MLCSITIMLLYFERIIVGIYINIAKISEKDGVYSYKVLPDNYSCKPFFIKISVNSKIVSFYEDEDCLHLLGFVDFDNDQGQIHIKGIPSSVAINTAVNAYRALKKGEFPDSLSVAS